MKKYIHLKKEDREFIANAFGVSGRSVYNALHFTDNHGGTELMRKIRKIALDRGGIVMVEAPETETLFDADGYIRQYLPGGTLLEINKEEGYCDVYRKGEKLRRFEEVMLGDIQDIQDWAQQLN